ncbi:MAG: zf-TFIIB domain-containing protein [Spirochaetales bacterium]|nr:zf-TFIIB domain-containing protein [Spirochaetales bacterium]
MDCPVCKNHGTLTNKQIEKDLEVKECESCFGNWIPSFEYWRWLEKHNWRPPTESGIDSTTVEIKTDSVGGKICPECRHILISAKVGYGCEFCIEKCNHCGGIWLDKDEWAILKSKKLNDQLHYMFSHIWQTRVKKAENEAHYILFLKEKLGEEDFNKLFEFKEWMLAHKEKDVMIAHLIHRI